MKIKELLIQNFKSIHQLFLDDMDHAVIFVGKNNTGKTSILSAILTLGGMRDIQENDFYDLNQNIRITVSLEITDEDLALLHKQGLVSKYKRYEPWFQEFCTRLPSYENHLLSFSYIANRNGTIRYFDGYRKNNGYIPAIFPKIHYLDYKRELDEIQSDIFLAQKEDSLTGLRKNTCIFDSAKPCKTCFHCIGLIEQKMPEELSVMESVKLLEYKLYKLNLSAMGERINYYFHKNSGFSKDIIFQLRFNVDEIFQLDTILVNKDREKEMLLEYAGEGLKSIYILSLLEAYIEENSSIPCIIMIEDPEIYLHPQLQKTASEILYRLSKKNQVIFSTHSPAMIFNFTSRQINQVVLDREYSTTINRKVSMSSILNDLGYTANDLMDVSFVFIVEGKQDRSRLPILLAKYYSEVIREDGQLQRIAVITTNSCTNIKTYANLKYMNQVYIKDQFLMIRDSDGKDPEELRNQLCGYYKQRSKEDEGVLPRVTNKNVLILKYYSFENYFLDPDVMTEIGIVKSREQFFSILYGKYKEYLHRLVSVKQMLKKTGITIQTKEDLENNLETIRIYVRGHNLYDIFYGRYKGKDENDILKAYIDAAPRECFADILEQIDSFVYFDSRKI